MKESGINDSTCQDKLNKPEVFATPTGTPLITWASS
jgi:hypothetical protein